MNRILTLFLVFLGSLLCMPAHAGETVMNAYLTIQQSLASDSMKDVQASAREIVKHAHDSHVRRAALAISRDTAIEAARKDFKGLSNAMAKSGKHPGLERVSCPMAHAEWLQKKGKIMNPYLGKTMQDCGEVKSEEGATK